MELLLAETAGPQVGQEQQAAFISGMRSAGCALDLPDTPQDAAEFGYPGNGAGRGSFPQVRVVGLGECGTRAVLSPPAARDRGLLRDLLARPGPVTCCWPTATCCPTAC